MRRSRLRDVCFLACSLLSGQSFIITRDTDTAMHTLVARILAEDGFDAIHADQLWMAQYALSGKGVMRVLDQHNAVYLIPQRLAQTEGNPLKRLLLEREWRKLACYEAQMCRQFDRIITVTREDRALLLGLAANPGTQLSMTAIPICIDPDSVSMVERRPGAKGVLHLGTMFWAPNVEGVLWFAHQVLPLVQREVPDVRFYVVGKNPPGEIQSLAQRTSSPVVVTGYVGDPTSYLQESAAFIVPLHAGGGMRVKILDAWVRGIPVISTSIGAEGIEYTDGENILIADEPGEFAHAVVRVIRDAQLSRRLSENGRRWVEAKYDWRVVYRRLDDVYTSVT
jgi:polysaccharide biosynthesis protein PslH